MGQLLEISPPQILQAQYEELLEARGHRAETYLGDDLVAHLEKTFMDCFMKGFIVIDGLDECVDAKQILPRLLRWSSTRKIKVLIVSRDSSEIKSLLENSPKLALTAELLRQDVENFISEKVFKLVEGKELKIRDPRLSASIADELSYKAQGM